MNAGPQPSQFSLFGSPPADVTGLEYRADFISPAEESRLVEHFQELPFRAFEFHGFLGKRRTVSFGWHYSFVGGGLVPAADMPAFLLPIRDKAAQFAAIAPSDLQHVLITEYAPGAGIGWHKDKAVFDEVIGISLLSPCAVRLRRKVGASWKRASFLAEPRSAYLLKGPVRNQWQHSIAPLESLRYSITFRKLRSD